MKNLAVVILVLISFGITGLNFTEDQSYSSKVYSLKPNVSTASIEFDIDQGVELKYTVHSCVDGNGCCGIRCEVGLYAQCCAATSCICIGQSDQDLLASIYDWQEFWLPMWLNIDSTQLNSPASKAVLENYIDYCEE